MICEAARELIGGDPETNTPELLEHLGTCAQCQAYREEMLALNARIRRALELDVQKLRGPGTPGKQQPAPSVHAASNVTALRRKERAPVPKHPRPKLFAFAASLAAALVVGFTLWLSRPTESLAAEIVLHVQGEPGSWAKTQPVTAATLEAVLRKSRVKLGPGMQPVVYASSCFFRGHFVPHFVVKTDAGPVTVMILSNEHVDAAQQFTEAGFSGLLVPARTGSVAVISQTPMSLEKPAREVVTALQSAT